MTQSIIDFDSISETVSNTFIYEKQLKNSMISLNYLKDESKLDFSFFKDSENGKIEGIINNNQKLIKFNPKFKDFNMFLNILMNDPIVFNFEINHEIKYENNNIKLKSYLENGNSYFGFQIISKFTNFQHNFQWDKKLSYEFQYLKGPFTFNYGFIGKDAKISFSLQNRFFSFTPLITIQTFKLQEIILNSNILQGILNINSSFNLINLNKTFIINSKFSKLLTQIKIIKNLNKPIEWGIGNKLLLQPNFNLISKISNDFKPIIGFNFNSNELFNIKFKIQFLDKPKYYFSFQQFQ